MAEDDKSKVSWMYDGIKGATSREDYLLGKRVRYEVEAYIADSKI